MNRGRAQVPSFYFLEILRAAEGRLPELREMEKRAAAPVVSRLGFVDRLIGQPRVVSIQRLQYFRQSVGK